MRTNTLRYSYLRGNCLILKNLSSPSTGSGRTASFQGKSWAGGFVPRGKRWASQAQRQPTMAAVVSFFFDCSGRRVVPRGKRWASRAQRQPTTAATLDPSKGRPHLDPPLEKGEGEQSKASLCKWDIWLPFGDLRCSLKTSIKSTRYNILILLGILLSYENHLLWRW